MKSLDTMNTLSQCGLGAALIDRDCLLLEINETGERLLGGLGRPGGSLLEIAPAFCGALPSEEYCNISFGEYLRQCPSPEVEDLPAGVRMVVFRDARNDICHDMLMCAINQVSDSVILCDEQGRVFLLNDAATRLESTLAQEIVGRNLQDVYTVKNESDLEIPRVMRECKPRLNIRQHYVTKHGKEVAVMDDTYPVILNGKVVGGFSVMRDWTQVDRLNRQVIELQQKLLGHDEHRRRGGRSPLSAKYRFEDIVFNSAVMRACMEKCEKSAKSDSGIMICGETGTGKELFAQGIHNASHRADGPFLAINCAAIPENLLESMLFGTEKGAYTGAERRVGLFEQADGGTLLLDEINSMPLSLQPKLLRVLQEGVVRRVGGIDEIPVDVRMISNINISPWQAVREKKLRPDLLYRLGVVNITIPPLRDRACDIPLLAKHFVLSLNRKMMKNIKEIAPDAMERLCNYSWPGNVRELQHAIEYAMNILPDDALVIPQEMLPDHILHGDSEETPGWLEQRKSAIIGGIGAKMGRDELTRLLQANGGNITQTARMLGISRQNLQYRIKRDKIDPAKSDGIV
ncbi:MULTISPECIES: sigma-54 interaction domain-containing protein [unclassified Oscillibacter]|uniref:sigma-54 interaction domain-containing protein n=1 Tax=unclassified Oscillibacter TaxID=2629304 RepID=UPI0025FCD2C0|nr:MULTISPECIES: sigma 54-interacting transcriptional regulator [unclassified Oscillibacter]